MKQVLYRIVLGLLILGALVGFTAATTGNENVSEQGFQGISQEIGLPEEPETPVNPFLSEEREKMFSQSEFVSGVGNLTERVEVNNTAGESATGVLLVIGTNETSWKYQLMSDNSTDNCFVWANISVQNAQKVLFVGQANNTARQVAYAGIGLEEGGWKNAGPYSGTVKFKAAVDEKNSGSMIESYAEQGSIIHISEAYLETGNQSLVPNTSHTMQILPRADLDPALQVAAAPTDVLFYDHYAGSYLKVKEGLVHNSAFTSWSSPNAASSMNVQNIGKTKKLVTNTIGEEWPEGHLEYEGSGSYEQFKGDEVTSLTHIGKSEFKNGDSSAFGKSDATGKHLDYLTISAGDREANPLMAGYTLGSAQAGQVSPIGSGQMPVPASFTGWVLAENTGGRCKNSEKYSIHGAYVERQSEGGNYPEKSAVPETGVLANISAGKQGSPPGASGLQGMAVLTINGTDADPTTLNGRWIATSPTGIPVNRSIKAMMPGRNAYSGSSTVNGVKDIRESGYYRSGMVDTS